MYCPNCGKETTGRFCADCGTEVKVEVAASTNVVIPEDKTLPEVKIDFRVKKSPIKSLIGWVVSILLFLIGLAGLIAGSTIAGIATILLGLIFNPVFSRLMSSKISFFNGIWFRCCAVIVFCFVFNATANFAPAEPVSTSSSAQSSIIPSVASSASSSEVALSSTSSSEPSSSEDISDEAKQIAIDLDAKIYEKVLAVESNHNILLSAIENADTLSLVDLYDIAKSAVSAQRSYSTDFLNLETKENRKYVEACRNYTSNSSIVADSILKYIDKGEVKYLSNAKESIEYSDTLILSIVSERMEYLSSQGLGDEEIVKIFEQASAVE